jgi:hypothetical protein
MIAIAKPSLKHHGRAHTLHSLWPPRSRDTKNGLAHDFMERLGCRADVSDVTAG